MKAIIVRTEANEKLEEYHHAAMVESSGQAEIDKKEQEKQDALIFSLQDSSNFATTHAIISQLNEFNKWNENQRKLLYDTAVENSQVRLIINDEDVNSFYRKLISEEPVQRQKEIETKIL